MQNILNSLIGIGGLIIAGLSIYLNYKERRKYLRESLYNKQIEVINEVSLYITELYHSLYNLLDQIILIKINQNNSNEYHIRKLEIITNNWKEIEKNYNEFVKKYRTWLIFLPDDINIAINNFISLFLDIEENINNKDFDTKDIDNINNKYDRIIGSFRKFLGIKKLSDETKKLIRERSKQ